MQSLFTDEGVQGIQARLEKLTPETKAEWGKMNVSQMLAHCQRPLEVALGEMPLRTNFIAKLIGPLFKKKYAKEGVPFDKNSPTGPDFKITDAREFEPEKAKLTSAIKRFSEKGRAGSLGDRHPFFGKMSQKDWDVMQWKHLDHHLRQFGV